MSNKFHVLVSVAALIVATSLPLHAGPLTDAGNSVGGALGGLGDAIGGAGQSPETMPAIVQGRSIPLPQGGVCHG